MEKQLQMFDGQITEDIIKIADNSTATKCIGAKTLAAALSSILSEKPLRVSWGYFEGNVDIGDTRYVFTTAENVNMPFVKEAQSVTFLLKRSVKFITI